MEVETAGDVEAVTMLRSAQTLLSAISARLPAVLRCRVTLCRTAGIIILTL